MNSFFVKFKDGTEQIISATCTTISESVSQVSLTKPLDYEKLNISKSLCMMKKFMQVTPDTILSPAAPVTTTMASAVLNL